MSNPNIPDDIKQTAIALAGQLGKDVDPLPIAQALFDERNANAAEIETWRDKWRITSFREDANYALAEHTRDWVKEIIGINATWVDDDLRVLAHLADLAVSHGLTAGLNQACQEAIAELKQKRRQVAKGTPDA